MATELSWDAVYWALSGSELSPRNPPLPVAGRVDVRKDVPHLDGVGRLWLPAEAVVAYPVGFGTDGTELEGSLVAGYPPTPPTLAAEDLGGAVVRLTISGSTVETSNWVFIRDAMTLIWPAMPNAIILGDGSADVTLVVGPYLAKVQSNLAGAVSPADNEPVLFYLADAAAGYTRSDFGEEWNENARPELLAAFGEPVTYRRGVQTLAIGAAIQARAVHVNDPATGVDIVVGDCAWEIDADELDFGAGQIVPKAQDQIITAKGEVYVVAVAGSLDAEQTFWTIPVKRSEYKEPS